MKSVVWRLLIYKENSTNCYFSIYLLGWETLVIVPKNSLDAYKHADQWKDFFLIEGSATGITNTVYNKAGLADVYTIDGTKRLSKASTDEINALPKGVYIVNGKKIIIK